MKDFAKSIRTGNSMVGNTRQLVYQRDYEHGIKVEITKDSQRDDDFFWSIMDPYRVAFGIADSLSKAQSQSHAAAKRREKLYKE